eukprot:SAG11_NODE_1994_length_3953_cov_2.436430_4_plen_69_part_00
MALWRGLCGTAHNGRLVARTILAEVDLVEDVLFVPLSVAEVVRIVHYPQHSPLVVRVIVQAGCPLERP